VIATPRGVYRAADVGFRSGIVVRVRARIDKRDLELPDVLYVPVFVLS
jgi:hypothetical protein